MLDIRSTEIFDKWLRRLRDRRAKAVILKRLRRASLGHLGDVSSVGGGVSEFRIHHGPGYRVYFVRHEKTIIVLLCGGDKGSQSRDIEKARELARSL